MLVRCARPARGHGAGVDGLLSVGGDHGQDVAAVDAAQTEGFQMPDQCALADIRFGKAMPRRYGISGIRCVSRTGGGFARPWRS